MSDKIVPFKGKDEQPEEQHSCETCDLVWEFMSYVAETETPEELFEVLSGLVNEGKILGQKELLIAQVNQNLNMLDQLDGFDCDCEDCCENKE